MSDDHQSNETTTRRDLARLAAACFARAGGNSDPVWSTFEGLHHLVGAMLADGAPLEPELVEEVKAAMWAAVLPLVESAQLPLTADRVAATLGAAAKAFELACRPDGGHEGVREEYARELVDHLLWAKAEIEAAHYRARIAARGDWLFQSTLARRSFEFATPSGPAH